MVRKSHLWTLECSFPCTSLGKFLPILCVWAWMSPSWSHLPWPPHPPLGSVSSNIRTLLTPALSWLDASILCFHVCLLHDFIPSSHTGELHKWGRGEFCGFELVAGWCCQRQQERKMEKAERFQVLIFLFFKVKKQQGYVSSRKQRIQLNLKPPSLP